MPACFWYNDLFVSLVLQSVTSPSIIPSPRASQLVSPPLSMFIGVLTTRTLCMQQDVSTSDSVPFRALIVPFSDPFHL